MILGVTFTEKEKEILKELSIIYDKMINDNTIFDCDCCVCDNCPFGNHGRCAIEMLNNALKIIVTE